MELVTVLDINPEWIATYSPYSVVGGRRRWKVERIPFQRNIEAASLAESGKTSLISVHLKKIYIIPTAKNFLSWSGGTSDISCPAP
jgi:hypothetical protein